MQQAGSLELPAPGGGRTAARWARLLDWGRVDLPLARLAEGHTDALAILAEAGADPMPDALYGVWAARSGGTGAELAGSSDHPILRGTVRFCSGAHGLDRALVVASTPDGSRVVDLDLDRPGVRPVGGSWQAPGMRDSDTVDVELTDVALTGSDLLGTPDWYTERLGFWWGGAGVAAVWLGGALGALDLLRGRLQTAPTRSGWPTWAPCTPPSRPPGRCWPPPRRPSTRTPDGRTGLRCGRCVRPWNGPAATCSTSSRGPPAWPP